MSGGAADLPDAPSFTHAAGVASGGSSGSSSYSRRVGGELLEADRSHVAAAGQQGVEPDDELEGLQAAVVRPGGRDSGTAAAGDAAACADADMVRGNSEDACSPAAAHPATRLSPWDH